MDENEKPVEGAAGHFCLIFTFPYRKIASSKVGKKISRRMKLFKNWIVQKEKKKK